MLTFFEHTEYCLILKSKMYIVSWSSWNALFYKNLLKLHMSPYHLTVVCCQLVIHSNDQLESQNFVVFVFFRSYIHWTYLFINLHGNEGISKKSTKIRNKNWDGTYFYLAMDICLDTRRSFMGTNQVKSCSFIQKCLEIDANGFFIYVSLSAYLCILSWSNVIFIDRK